MSRRDAGATGQRARHVRARLQATLGEGRAGLLEDGLGLNNFAYQDPGDEGETESGSPAGAPRLRWRVGRRVAVLLAVLAAAAGAWFWWQAAAATPEVLPLSGAGPRGTGALAEAPADAGTPSPSGSSQGGTPPAGVVVVVHVAGAVVKPGVIMLQHGSRINDAITAAGGAAPEADTNRLNLALVVEDGQKIYVPQKGETIPPAAGSGSGGADPGASGIGGSAADAGSGAGQHSTAGGKINLNTADVAELDTLPKVGPVLAQRIVDWRKEHGPFTNVEELDAVDGVGPKMLEALLPLVTV